MAYTNSNPSRHDPGAEPRTPTERRRRPAPALPQDDVAHTAASRTQPDRVPVALEHAIQCARISDDNRAKDILLLDLRNATPLLDFFVIASANSRATSRSGVPVSIQSRSECGA